MHDLQYIKSFFNRFRFEFCLSIIAIFTFFLAKSPDRVERFYSMGFYPMWVKTLPDLFSRIPFSMGDLLYVAFFSTILLLGIVKSYKNRINGIERLGFRIGKTIFRIVIYFIFFYLLFLWVWGLNYFRSGIVANHSSSELRYSEFDLIRLNESLLSEINTMRPQQQPLLDNANVVIRMAYDSANLLPSGGQERLQAKKSLFSSIISYLGISGYFNPFTGEAQMDASYPSRLSFFVAAHEVAHQLGYAKEDEANCLAFLASEHTKDSALRYSSNVQLFIYANRALNECDSIKAGDFRKRLSAAARGDIKELINYYESRKNPIEPMITAFYSSFMKSHKQPKGIGTYREVLSLVIGYFRKNKW